MSKSKLKPPVNFSVVERGVYRSGFPSEDNLQYLEQLGLRSIVYLCPETYPEANADFIRKNNIKLYHFGIEGNKEPLTDMPTEIVSDALKVVLDQRNHPLLIHCHKGKHRTGCLVGCLRKVQNWNLSSVIEEYRQFAGSKARIMDEYFLNMFDVAEFMQQRGSQNGSSSYESLTGLSRCLEEELYHVACSDRI